MSRADHAPAVSIGLPIYNGEAYVSSTLASLLGQTFTDLELIVSDNASTDATAELCQVAARGDARVRYVRQERNMGAAWNYNETVRLARGRYFMWTGHDDLRHPTHLERCLARFDADGEGTVLVYPRTMLIDDQGHELRAYDDGLDLPQPTPSGRAHRLLANLGLANAVFGVIRLDELRATGLIRPFVYSDLVLLYELALRGRFSEVPEPLFSRRIHHAMSHRANRSADSRLAWFTGTSASGQIVMPRTRLYLEMMRVTAHAPIDAGERARCLARLFQIWGPKYAKLSVRELAVASLTVARRRLPGRPAA